MNTMNDENLYTILHAIKRFNKEKRL